MRGAMTHLMAAVVAVALAAGCKSSGDGSGDTKGTGHTSKDPVGAQLRAEGKEASGAPAAKDQAALRFVNSTNVWIQFYVDGSPSASVPAGDEGRDVTTVGNHTLKAKTTDGREVSDSVYVPAGGFVWTIYIKN